MWTLVEFLFTLVYVAFVVAIYWYMTVPKSLPPGPMGLPFIGSSLNTWNTERQHIVLSEWALKYGPLFKVYIGCKLVVVLGDWATIHEALVKKGEAFAGRPRFSSFQPPGIPHNHGIIFSDGDVWKEQRQFASVTLRDMGFGRSILEPRIKEEVEYLLSEMAATKSRAVDIEKMVENAVSNIICVMLFGKRYDYKNDKFRRLLDALKLRANQSNVGFLSPFILSPWLGGLLAMTPIVKKFKLAAIELTGLVRDEIQACSTHYDPNSVPNNYIHAFLKMRESGVSTNFTEAQLAQIGVELFAAGTETTANTIRWAVLHLAYNQELQEKMYEELRSTMGVGTAAKVPPLADKGKFPFTEAVIMETQRIANLVPLSVMHRTMTSCKLLGYEIPADTLVVPLLTAALMDPIVYPEPEKFDPYRFLEDGKVKKDPKWIPFSAGKRVCLGEPLAKMELFLFFAGIFRNYQFVFPDDEPPPPIKASIGFTNIPISYKVRVIPRPS